MTRGINRNPVCELDVARLRSIVRVHTLPLIFHTAKTEKHTQRNRQCFNGNGLEASRTACYTWKSPSSSSHQNFHLSRRTVLASYFSTGRSPFFTFFSSLLFILSHWFVTFPPLHTPFCFENLFFKKLIICVKWV